VVDVITGLRNIFEIGKASEQGRGESGALAHGNDRLRAPQRIDDRVIGRQLFRENMNFDLLTQPLDRVCRFECALVVVENRDFHY